MAAKLKLLVDTNVLLDVILQRAALMKDSAAVLDAIEGGRATGYVAGHALTTVYYIVRKANGAAAAATAVSDILDLCEVVPVDDAVLRRSLAMGMSDYEDAVQAAAAAKVGADYLVTRNEKDFKASPVPARNPATVAALVSVPSKMIG